MVDANYILEKLRSPHPQSQTFQNRNSHGLQVLNEMTGRKDLLIVVERCPGSRAGTVGVRESYLHEGMDNVVLVQMLFQILTFWRYLSHSRPNTGNVI